jgi:hypothetical protein
VPTLSTQQATTEKRRIAKIVFDRPPLRKLSFLLWTLAGLALGIGCGALLYFVGNDENPNFSAVLEHRELYGWFYALATVGLLGGIMIGWGFRRGVSARIETVELPPLGRRRSAGTAMVRADLGRSRY